MTLSVRRQALLPALLTALIPCTVTVAQPVRAAAPSTNDTLAYVYLRGTDTVAIERVVSRADGVRGELVVKGQPRVVWHQHVGPNNSAGAFDLYTYAATASAEAAPTSSITLRIVGDSGFMDVNNAGATNTLQRLKVPAGSEWMLNTSVLHTDVLASLARKRKQDTVKVVLAQGGTPLRMALRSASDTTIVNLVGNDARFVHDALGLKEAIMGGNTTVRRVSAADRSKLNLKRDTYDAPVGAPYTAEDVIINTASGFQIAGTLTRPRRARQVPIVITISGSGQQERDSRLATVNGYAIFREIADTLGRRGIAVLRVDDRGVGASTGRETLPVVTSADFANDVREVIKYVRSRSDVDTARIALLGHSEGGMIAPMVASQDKSIRAIALLAGTAYTGRRVMMFQNQEAVNQSKTLTAPQRDSIMATVPARLDTLAITNPWIGFFMQHDPLRTARLVSQPVLILQGETDRQVTPEQADTLATAMRTAGNKDVTVKRFAATNHLFLADDIGVPSGYAQLPDKRVRRIVLGTLADWLVQKLR